MMVVDQLGARSLRTAAGRRESAAGEPFGSTACRAPAASVDIRVRSFRAGQGSWRSEIAIAMTKKMVALAIW